MCNGKGFNIGGFTTEDLISGSTGDKGFTRMTYNPDEFDKYMEDARLKAENEDIELIGTVNTSDKAGYALVKGKTDSYKVGYLLDSKDNMYGHSCSCPHNHYRGVPCKHMYVANRDLDNFTIVK